MKFLRATVGSEGFADFYSLRFSVLSMLTHVTCEVQLHVFPYTDLRELLLFMFVVLDCLRTASRTMYVYCSHNQRCRAMPETVINNLIVKVNIISH